MAASVRKLENGEVVQAGKANAGTLRMYGSKGRHDEEDDPESADEHSLNEEDAAERLSGKPRKAVAQRKRKLGRGQGTREQRPSRLGRQKQSTETERTGHTGYPLHFNALGTSDFLSAAQLDQLIEENGLYAPRRRTGSGGTKPRTSERPAAAAGPSLRSAGATKSTRSSSSRSRTEVRSRLLSTLGGVKTER